ncbi:MAG: aldehyde ferredoxin oxidoreductase C-terminal domain-containing protein [Desulfofustis sp.]
MAGYATGPLFFAAQSLGFRHSHLDTGAYSYEQKEPGQDLQKAVDYLIDDEPGRVFLTSMVACLFARSVYQPDTLAQCLAVTGFESLADSMEETAINIQRLRWQVRVATGFNPEDIAIPKRFYEVSTIRGPVDGDYLDLLKEAYGRRIMKLAAPDED